MAIPASSTITLCLMLHEFATIAAKYGALSDETGRLSIGWTADVKGTICTIDFSWHEQSGHAIAAPVRKGFGSRLLAASSLQPNDELEMAFAADGLKARLRFAVPTNVRFNLA